MSVTAEHQLTATHVEEVQALPVDHLGRAFATQDTTLTPALRTVVSARRSARRATEERHSTVVVVKPMLRFPEVELVNVSVILGSRKTQIPRIARFAMWNARSVKAVLRSLTARYANPMRS
jgi:hypothetical protein